MFTEKFEVNNIATRMFIYTMERVSKDHPNDQKTGLSSQVVLGDCFSYTEKCTAFCQECVVFQDRWSVYPIMAVASQDRFHCTAQLLVVCQRCASTGAKCACSS